MMHLLTTLASAATLTVGPGKDYPTPCAAAAAVNDGDTVEIDAGLYTADVCAWTANGLTLRGVGGFAHLDAAGANAQGKGTWVIQGNDTTVAWIEFSGATVPDRNGAGIRQEGANLTVDHCWFHDNEDGILAGDNADSDIVVTNSEFADNGFGDGLSHNLYINHVRSLVFSFNNSHHAYKGHTLKSRALETSVLYNRLADDADGQGSYQIDLPNGGIARVVGNVIQQGPAAENSGLVSFAAEGASNPDTALWVVNNTFVNDRGSGTFVANLSSVDAVLVNNLFVGGGTVLSGPGTQAASLETDGSGFLDAAAGDYHLQEASPAVDAGLDPGTGDGVSLTPDAEYSGTDGGVPRVVVGSGLDLGAFEFGTPPADTDAPSDTDAPPDTDAPSDTDAPADTDAQASDAAPGGCGCASSPLGASGWVVAGLAVVRRRRARS